MIFFKRKGACFYKMTQIPSAAYPKLFNLLPNQSLYLIFINGLICKLSNLHIINIDEIFKTNMQLINIDATLKNIYKLSSTSNIPVACRYKIIGDTH